MDWILSPGNFYNQETGEAKRKENGSNLKRLHQKKKTSQETVFAYLFLIQGWRNAGGGRKSTKAKSNQQNNKMKKKGAR